MPLPGYITDPATTPEEQDALGPRDPASTTAVSNVLLSGGPTGSLTDLVGREARRDVSAVSQALGLAAPSPTLSVTEANQKYGIDGHLSFSKPVSEEEAAWRHEGKRDELFRQNILARNRTVGPLGVFGTSLVGGVVDPVGVGLTLVPVIGEGRVAELLGVSGEAASRAGAFGQGVRRGAIEGGVGSAAAESLTYGLAHGREGRDYSASDLALGISIGAVFGAGAGGLLHGLGWRAPAEGRGDADFAARIERLGEKSRQDQVSPKGAIGVMQLEPDTARAAARRLGVPFDEDRLRTDPAYNRMLGAEEARHLLARYEGDELLAAAAYNAGPGRVDDWIKQFGDPRTGAISHAEFAKRIPFKETRDYVGRVAGEGYGGSATVAAGGGFDPIPAPASMIDETARAGAFAKAIDDLANDRPVEVGALIDAEHAATPEKPSLDEGADPGIGLNARLLDPSTAVTVRGTEIPVRYAVADLKDLKTSHDDDLVKRPDYPADLQPRDRERAGSQARLLRMEREFSPLRLIGSSDAESGAPIIARDGVVESGNGRTIMLRRNALRGTEVYARYKAALEAHGYDLTGFEHPVLVRVRTQPLAGADRVRLAREMNADVTERLSVTEQAFEDARALSDADLGVYRGGEVGAAANRPFHRLFVEKAAPGQENAVVDGATQGLTQEGERRIQAAMVARAYGDRELVYSVFETTDEHIVAIGKALTGAAPDWAAMRAAVARGEAAEWADTTDALTSAVALVRHARENRLDLENLIRNRRDQVELFDAQAALSPETEWYLRLFFRDETFKRPTGAATIEAALKDQAVRARDTQPGPGLFGEEFNTNAREILQAAVQRAKGQEGEQAGLELHLGGAEARPLGSGPPPPPREDIEVAGEPHPAGGAEAGVRPGDSGRPGEAGGGAGSAGLDQPPQRSPQNQSERQDREIAYHQRLSTERARRLLGDDPELKALVDDIASLTSTMGVQEGDEGLTPEAIAEAVRAAEFCLREG